MRVLLMLLILLLGSSFSGAATGPMNAKEVALMLRSGFTSHTVQADLTQRRFAGSIDAASEKELLAAGAHPVLVEALKCGVFSPEASAPIASEPTLAQIQQRNARKALLTMNADHQRAWAQSLPRPQMSSEPPVLSVPPFERTEQQWLVDEIVRDLAEIVVFSHEPTLAADKLKVSTVNEPPHSTTFRVVIEAPGGRVEKTIELQHHVWSSMSYAAFAAELMAKWPAKPLSPLAPDQSLLNALLKAESSGIIRQSKRVSDLLSRRPLDPDLHEQAALIIGSLALREAAGDFADTRRLLCRIATHLSLAAAVRPNESETGKLARIIALCLAGRQQEAVDSIATLAPEHSRWATALRMRATGDWRLLKEPAKASALEQMELFRALRGAGARAHSLALLGEINAGRQADWSRLGLERRMSVQEGHVFAKNSLPVELVSTVEDWQTFVGTPLAEPQLVEVLNRPATRALGSTIEGQAQLEVLSWGHFAAFHQRHLCQAAVQTADFVGAMLGLPDEAKALEREAEKLLSGLTLYPLVKAKFDVGRKLSMSAAFGPEAKELMQKQPELLTSSVWTTYSHLQMHAASWFQPSLPFGTVYDLGPRHDGFAGNALATQGLPLVNQLASLAPYYVAAGRMVVFAKHGRNPTAEQIASATRSFKDFNIPVMWDIAERLENDPAAYAKAVEAICAIEPNHFIKLGNYLVKNRMFPEAAKAFQSAYDQALDRVAVSNGMEWLVLYYFDNGRSEEAMKIAKDGAESYSGTGLATMAMLLEKMGRLPEAEDYYKKLRDRYKDPGLLSAFYRRNRHQSREYERADDAIIAATFPAGFEEVQLASLREPPRDGVVIRSSSDRVQNAGLKVGDIIVALDGKRARSEEQYLFLRDQDADKPMTLIVWNGVSYTQVAVSLPKRRMNCEIRTFAAR